MYLSHPKYFILFYYFFKIYFIYLFLAALGLCCCVRAFSSCGERGLLFVAVRGLLIAGSSLVAEHGLQVCRLSLVVAHGLQQLWLAGSRAQAQQLWCTGLVALWHVGSSRTRAQTIVPCIGRWILNQCTMREAPKDFILWNILSYTSWKYYWLLIYAFKIIPHQKREPSYTVGGNVNWCSHYGEQYGGSSKN